MRSTFIPFAAAGLLSIATVLAQDDPPLSSLPASVSTAIYPKMTYVPSVDADYKPTLQGLPIVHINTTLNPTLPRLFSPPSISLPGLPPIGPPKNPSASSFWYEHITHNGISPYITNGHNWTVYRNVRDYGAKGDGQTDDSAAIQAAIDFGGRGPGGNGFGTTGAPAVVYFPEGTYLMKTSVQSYVDTMIIGNPISRPTLKVSSDFDSSTLLFMKDPSLDATINFYIQLKNLVLDSTAFPGSKPLTLIDWSVSQATQLTNILFNMPSGSAHTGVSTPEGGSGTYMGNLDFVGGAVGINHNNQQYSIKDCTFKGANTGILISHGFDVVFNGMSFENVNIGINATAGGVGNVGSYALVDSSATNVKTVVLTKSHTVGNTTTGDDSVIIDNLQTSNVDATVVADGVILLKGDVPKTWVYGNAYLKNGPSQGIHDNGVTYQTTRSGTLLGQGGKYFTMAPPTYQEYSVDQIVNVKDVKGFPVYGDGQTDDTHNLALILARNALTGQISFFPAGTYLLSSTLILPPGTRIVGEAYSALSATGSYFSDSSNPKPMVQLGTPGSIGMVQISDMLFTVAQPLQGCILVQVQICPPPGQQGAVGLWNSHFRVGGAAGSTVETECTGPEPCKAAFLLLHLAPTAGAYIEDMWGWLADHDLDGNNNQVISSGRGMLVESSHAVWLFGTAFEHNTLYQYNFVGASNVLVSMQQCETPYWQGTGGPAQAPAPWTIDRSWHDPSWANCKTDDPNCRMAWYQRIAGGSDLYIYGSGFWTFFNDVGDCQGVDGSCQDNAVEIVGQPQSLWWWNLNTRGVLNGWVDNGIVRETAANNPGSWEAIVAASLEYAGIVGRRMKRFIR